MHPVDELVDRIAIPPAFHVGFAQAQRWITQNAVLKALIIELYIPGIVAIDLNFGQVQ